MMHYVIRKYVKSPDHDSPRERHYFPLSYMFSSGLGTGEKVTILHEVGTLIFISCKKREYNILSFYIKLRKYKYCPNMKWQK